MACPNIFKWFTSGKDIKPLETKSSLKTENKIKVDPVKTENKIKVDPIKTENKVDVNVKCV